MAFGVPDCENGGARCVMVAVGLQMDAEGKELLDWTISNVAQQGDRVVAVHVFRDSELENTTTTSLIAELYGYLAAYDSFCSNQKVALAGRVSPGNSIWEVLVEEAKLCSAVTVVIGVAKNSSLGFAASLAKYCAEKLPATTCLVAVQNGKVVFERNAKKSATVDVEKLTNEKNAEQIQKVSDVRSEVETEDDDANLSNSKSKGNGNGSSMISDVILCRKVQEPSTLGKPLLLPQVGKQVNRKLGTVLHPTLAINATSNNANSKANGNGCSAISDVKLSRKVQEPSALGLPLLLPQVANKVNQKLSTTLHPSLAIDVTLNNVNSKNNENGCSMTSDANLCRKVPEPSTLGRPLLLPQVGKQVNKKLGTVLHPSLAIDATLNNANSKGNGNGCSVISDVKLSRKVQEPSALGWPLLLPQVAKTVNKIISTTLHPSLAFDETLNNANSKDNENECSMISDAILSTKVQELSSLGWPLLLPQVGKQVNPKFGTVLHQNLAIDVERLTKEKNAKQIKKDFDVRSEVEAEENDAKLCNVNSKGNENGCSMISDSILSRMVQESLVRGWPLLRIAGREFPELKKMSVVQWVMKLPNRSLSSTKPYLNLVMELKTILRNSTSGCKWFQYDELYCATNSFSSVNLIGKGGSSKVYKGCLPRGQRVAIKLSKLTEEASKDFLVEFDIIIKLEHKGVVPLIGICVEGNTIISVCSYFSKGSLEENIHGNNMIKSPLSWDQRYKVAVGVAEALCYIHNGSSQPVIHRDVKSSNILLNENLEPQLSDFGLAIWAPTTSASLTLDDVVGTFGYLAPEYFMYGKVSDKIDVYAFGVVLLELLTGRKPISNETPNGLESLILWAKPILERGDFMDALDSNLDSTYNQVQLKRMISAASLCITRTAHLRPKMSKILDLLRGGEVLKHG